jgi:hypothetical protein
MQGISTCYMDVGNPTQARYREERSLQQLSINNIGCRPAIWAENKDIIHMCIISTTKKKTLTKWVYLLVLI